MKYHLEKHVVNIIWISESITPLSFSPEWFRRFELLREEDIAKSNTTVGQDVITTDYGWVEISTSLRKAVFQLSQIGLEKSLSDLTSSIFSMFSNSETKAIGVNTFYLYDMIDKNYWNAIGDSLVPKNIWQTNNNSKILKENVEYHFGLKNLMLAIENANNTDNDIYKETINATYLPLPISDEKPYGIQIQYNHDMALIKDSNSVSFTKLLPTIIPAQLSSAIENDIKSHENIFGSIIHD